MALRTVFGFLVRPLVLPMVLRAQALCYLAIGLWPLLSLRSFSAWRGPPGDDWLARTLGLLTASIGFTLWKAASLRPSALAVQLAGLSAASLLVSEVASAASGRAARIHWIFAAAQGIFLLAAAARARPSL